MNPAPPVTTTFMSNRLPACTPEPATARIQHTLDGVNVSRRVAMILPAPLVGRRAGWGARAKPTLQELADVPDPVVLKENVT